MTRLSDADIDDLITELSKTDWKALGRRMKAANRADRRGGTVRVSDGYPTGGGGPGPVNQVGRPTESAMLAGYKLSNPANEDHSNGAFVTRRDPVRDHVEHATAFLQQAVHSAKACAGRLDLIDSLGDTAVEPEPCESCARAGRQATMRNFSAVTKSGVELLDRAYRLCGWCYDWVYRHGKLPTVEQVDRHHGGLTVFERVGTDT